MVSFVYQVSPVCGHLVKALTLLVCCVSPTVTVAKGQYILQVRTDISGSGGIEGARANAVGNVILTYKLVRCASVQS